MSKYSHRSKQLSHWHTAYHWKHFMVVLLLLPSTARTPTHSIARMLYFHRNISLFHSILRRTVFFALHIRSETQYQRRRHHHHHRRRRSCCGQSMFGNLVYSTHVRAVVFSSTTNSICLCACVSVCARVVYSCLGIFLSLFTLFVVVCCAFLFLARMQLCVRRPQLINKL